MNTSIVKRALKHLPYVQELKEGNCCRYFIVKKHENNFTEKEVMYNTRRDVWNCDCRYSAYRTKGKICSHIAAAQIYLKDKKEEHERKNSY